MSKRLRPVCGVLLCRECRRFRAGILREQRREREQGVSGVILAADGRVAPRTMRLLTAGEGQ